MTTIPRYNKKAVLQQPDYNQIPQTAAEHRAFREAARAAGHLYVLMVEGFDHPSGEGTRFFAPNEAKAMKTAHSIAMTWSNKADGAELFKEPWYPTHGYTLYHVPTGRLIRKYIPPTPEEVAEGKVELVDLTD